jgi:hypothetical protein
MNRNPVSINNCLNQDSKDLTMSMIIDGIVNNDLNIYGQA